MKDQITFAAGFNRLAGVLDRLDKSLPKPRAARKPKRCPRCFCPIDKCNPKICNTLPQPISAKQGGAR